MRVVKARGWTRMAVFAASAAAQSGPSAAQGRLEVHADAACALTLDGRGAGTLAPDGRVVIELAPGTHDLECHGADWPEESARERISLQAGAAGETTPCRGAQCRAPALFALSGYWMWSGERDSAGRGWYVYLHTGHTQASAPDYRLNARALCVRPA